MDISLFGFAIRTMVQHSIFIADGFTAILACSHLSVGAHHLKQPALTLTLCIATLSATPAHSKDTCA